MNVSVSLSPEVVALIEAQVASGRYASASEVVRDALRLLEDADQRDAEELGRLREAWEEGAASGDAGPLDFAALRAEARERLRAAAKG
jgi:antitoxin ParD1/3/4